MLLYFNKYGQLLDMREYGSIGPRVGTTAYQIFAYFEDLDISSNYNEALIKFKRPDLEGSEYPYLFMSRTEITYDSNMGNGDYFKPDGGPNNDGKYPSYIFDFSKVFDSIENEQNNRPIVLLDTPGRWEASISLFSSIDGTNVSGLIRFDVGPAVSSYDDEPLEIPYDVLMINIANDLTKKVDKNSINYIRYHRDLLNSDLDTTIFVNGCVAYDYTTQKYYQISVNNSTGQISATAIVDDLVVVHNSNNPMNSDELLILSKPNSVWIYEPLVFFRIGFDNNQNYLFACFPNYLSIGGSYVLYNSRQVSIDKNSGAFVVPTNGYVEFYNRSQIDSKLSGKVDKYTSSSVAGKVYGVTASGSQTVFDVDRGDNLLIANSIVKRDENGQIYVPLNPTEPGHAVSKDYVEGVISTLKRNAYQVVESLPATGEEGIIYLISIGLNNYEQYIYEGTGYISLGTTQIDLSDYATIDYVDDELEAKAGADDIPGLQATVTVIRDALTNINGRVLTNYEVSYNPDEWFGVYTITYGGNVLNEEQARNYMEYMTGSRYLPTYDYERPKNSLFVDSIGNILKPQYDNVFGLKLFNVRHPFALVTTPNLITVTYNELKLLRNNSQLIPGRFYRITDYACTTVSTNTSSARHVFDIVVKAISIDKLSEEASAIQHAGDTYFSDCKLEAWKLWYCLDNDTDRFAWADTVNENGKGVIYRMIDEFGNDCPYDFKNILFTSTGLYTNAYTFSYTENGTIKDASLLANKRCYDNIMNKYILSYKQQLNFNVFYSTANSLRCFNNTIGGDCYNNTFGNDCDYNIIGNDCKNNTFSTYCDHNIFGNYCSNNTFGQGCSHNIFGNGFRYNTLGNVCKNNTFGNNCTYITFGDSSSTTSYCRYNIVDNDCSYLYITSSGTGSNSNQLQNIHIHLGVTGSSTLNPRTITVDRGLAYSTDIYANNSQTIILDN